MGFLYFSREFGPGRSQAMQMTQPSAEKMSISDITLASSFASCGCCYHHNDKDNIMPTTNQKQQRLLLLREIAERQNRYRYVEWLRCGEIDVDAIMSHQTIQREIRSIEASRYLNGKRGPYRAGGAIAEMRRDLDDSPGCWLKPQEFKEKYGMLRESFWKLVEMIRHNPVFHRKKGSRGRKQVKPEFQLMVLLAFLRTEGSGMNNRKGRNLFSIGQGSVAKYRDRAVQAILEEL